MWMCEWDQRGVDYRKISADREGEFVLIDSHSLQHLHPLQPLIVHQLKRHFKRLGRGLLAPRPAERKSIVIASIMGECIAEEVLDAGKLIIDGFH